MALNSVFFEQISIDRTSDVPAFKQLAGKLNCIIQLRQLSAGEILPTIRGFAAALGLNPNTVARAYGDLESAGVIAKRRGSGCVVASTRTGNNSKVLSDILKTQIDELISTAGAAGISPAELIQMIKSNSGAASQTPGQGPMKQKPVKNQETAITQAPPPTIWQPDDEFID